MAINQDNRVIHRFIRNISDYELGGEFYAQIIPLDTQAYAIYPDKDGNKLFYVIGDGEHTYTEIRDGLGNGESHKEYPVFTESNLDSINNGIEEEAEARRQADEVLQSNIDKEASERERFDNLLDETLCEEILIRTSADETLSQNISNETAAREAGDEVLQGRISDEEARALQAETVLQSTKQDVLTAGTGISIENNVISSTQSQIVVEDNLTSYSTENALSANMGRVLQDEVENVKARGRFLSLWDCSTGLAETNPPESPYIYKSGDYFIVGNVAESGQTNYRPSGLSYTTGEPSLVEESLEVNEDDTYVFDGSTWRIQSTSRKTVTFANIAGSPSDNVALNAELTSKQEVLVNQENIKSINGSSLLGSGNLEIAAHLEYPSTWPTTSSTTTKQFCDVVAADDTAVEGKTYLGEVRWSDLPGLVNGEVEVEIMTGTTASSKVIVLTLASGNKAPYMWKYTYWNGGHNVSGWKGFVPTTNVANKIYGTDSHGDQTTYDKDSFGKVDDVRIDGNSVVSNKIANLGTMAGADTADYSTKAVADTLYADISLEQTVETHTSDTDIHVTTAEKEIWNSKQGELTAGTNIEITNNVISTTSTTLHKVLNTVVQVASFVSDDTYEGYLYRVDIPVTGITANHVPYVMLSITDSISANYSTFVESGNGYVSMWSKALPESAITIPVITYE